MTNTWPVLSVITLEPYFQGPANQLQHITPKSHSKLNQTHLSFDTVITPSSLDTTAKALTWHSKRLMMSSMLDGVPSSKLFQVQNDQTEPEITRVLALS